MADGREWAGSAAAPLFGYAVALLAVVAGWALRLALTVSVGEGLPLFITFYPSVMLAALFAGRGPGLLATGLVVASVAYSLTPTGFAATTRVELLSLILFALMGVLLVMVTHRYRQSRAKATAYDAEMASRGARAEAELALQRSEERYRQLVEQVGDGIFVADADGHYLDVNAAGAQMLGYTREEILARRIADILCPDEYCRLPGTAGQLASGQVVVSGWRCRRRDGSTFLGEIVGRKLPDGRLLGILRDVSEARRVEAERQQERALLNSVMARTDVMLVYLDTDFNFVWVNQAYANACRMEPAAMIGRNHFALYPDAGNEATFRQVRASGQPVFYKDKPFVFPDQPERGTTYWDWSLAPDKDRRSQVVGLVFSLRETTSFVRAQLAVRESEHRFASLANAAPVFIWMSGPDKKCTWFNQQWLTFTGRTQEEELGEGWLAGLHPDDVERCLAIYDSSFDRRAPFAMDYRVRAADGEYRWLADQAAPHYGPDGEFLGYIGTCIDITERRRIGNALDEAQAFANGTIDAISAHLCVLDRSGRILAVNQAWRDFWEQHHPPSESPDYGIGADYLAICDAVPAPCPGNTTSMGIGIRQVISGERQHFSFEYPCHSPDEERWFVAKVTRFHGDSGNVVVAHEEVTERKRAEDAAQGARAEAELANEAKSRFLAAASHDLRQPLSALGIYMGILQHRMAPEDGGLWQNMSNCVAGLNELLSDLLDISKLDAGVVKPEIGDFAVAELLAGLQVIHQPEAALNGLRLRLRHVASSLHARTDLVLYRRMLGNLIANAIRYTVRGGVLVGCRRRQGKYWIEVYDTGIGIPEDKIGEIFEEFRQLDRGEHNRGSGLGLAIVARSASLLGLEVRVRSRPGKGSLFALELPLGAAGVVVPAATPAFRPARVAVVDDNLLLLDAMVCALEGLGHQVVAASSGLELFERLGAQSPDIVISDFRLAQGQTVFDVIEDARALFGADLPALLITGDTDPRLIRGMDERGIVVHHKPLQIETLQARIAQLAPRPG